MFRYIIKNLISNIFHDFNIIILLEFIYLFIQAQRLNTPEQLMALWYIL